jgi:hypothetical protein
VPKIKYIEKKFQGARLLVIQQANTIITEYQGQGFDLTLRQLYYQFVARDIIPNSQEEYKKLGETINDARLAGLIDWNAIIDRTRNLRSLAHWSSPTEIVDSCAAQFRTDRWAGQRYRPEVWIEKDALVGVIAGVCSELDVPYFSCRGYTSQSEMWGASQRMLRHVEEGQTPVILHFGDHDPSGMDMTRDIRSRLELFIGGDVQVDRLALNFNQVEEFNPPPNPAKTTDARAKAYIAEFGNESWELDALDPRYLATLVREQIEQLRDDEAWEEATAADHAARKALGAIAKRFPNVQAYLAWDPKGERLSVR